MDTSLKIRFWAKVDKSGDCWTWTGAKTGHGYGSIGLDGKNPGAHRVSWELANGPIPNGLCVLHKCDNPPCVNPAHLFLGTDQDNATDKAKKGRCAPVTGENHGRAKLTENQVRKIRRLCASGDYTHASLAKTFGVSRRAIGLIINRITWRNI